jgi:hypothetical protein
MDGKLFLAFHDLVRGDFSIWRQADVEGDWV